MFDGFTDLLLEQALAHLAGGDDEAAEKLLRAAWSSATRRPSTPRSPAPARSSPRPSSATCTSCAASSPRPARSSPASSPSTRTTSPPTSCSPSSRPPSTPPAPLPSGVVALLASALDARLAAVDIDGFVALVPLIERVEGLNTRERRELLACLYLDRGFLDSAADEWAAACDEHGPDAAALTGLSRVAAARGDHEDAEVFAEGARELAGQSAA